MSPELQFVGSDDTLEHSAAKSAMDLRLPQDRDWLCDLTLPCSSALPV
jgi:hypothetical protein